MTSNTNTNNTNNTKRVNKGTPGALGLALVAAKARWAKAQQHHALRGTPSRHLGAKPLGSETSETSETS